MPGRSETIHFQNSGGQRSLGGEGRAERRGDGDYLPPGVDNQGAADYFADPAIPQRHHSTAAQEFGGRLHGEGQSLSVVDNPANREGSCAHIHSGEPRIIHIHHAGFRIPNSFGRESIRGRAKEQYTK